MAIYWTIWAAFVLICGIGATAGALAERTRIYIAASGQSPPPLFIALRFLGLLPAGTFGMIFAPVPLIGLIIGAILTITMR